MKDKVSVAMATYNGELYIEEQINSILDNLNFGDELIISDDGSTDKTRQIISYYAKRDNRIKLIEGPKNGIKQNFANAIENCSGKYIFLSDQDDIWNKNKVKKVIEVFKKDNCLVVEHDAKIINEEKKEILSSFFEFRNCGSGLIKNIWKNTYIGCCMAFDSKLKEHILPIPNDIEMHDQWIGILGDKYGKTTFIKDKLILYRRHDNNSSNCFKHHPLSKMIKNRINLIKRIIKEKKI